MAANKIKKDDNVIRLSLFDRPLASGKVSEQFTVYNYLTFKNVVLGLGVATFLIFLGSAVSGRIAFLLAALLGLLGLILLEMSSRRKWEHDLMGQLRHMTADYERLVREVARNRNDTGDLRKKLSDAAGQMVRHYDKPAGEKAEQRMFRGIVEQIAMMDGGALQEEQPEDIMPLNDDSLKGLDERDVGKRLTDDQVLQLVNAALEKDRIDLFLQPIVTLPQRKLRFYETFSRIRILPEVYLPAIRYIEVAMQQDLMPVIDNLLLLRGLQVIRNTVEGDYNRAFFFNITSLTLNDPKFMGDLVEFISQNRTLAPQLIFEMGQKDLATVNADVLPIFDGLSKLGCRFSMDQVRSLSFDFAHLESHHIRFIKVEAPLLMAELREPNGLQRLKRLKAELDRNGIDLIVEKIETDRQVVELLDVEIDYGQGYLFGKPVLTEKI